MSSADASCYEFPEDVRLLKCRPYVDALTYCWSPNSYFRWYYRYGTPPQCSEEWDRLKFCFSLKGMSRHEAQQLLDQRRAMEHERRHRDHVWVFRQQPPEEFQAFFPNDDDEEWRV